MNMQFDPTSPEFRTHPYPFYDQLRAFAPIFYWESQNMWFLTRYEDCKALLSDRRLGHVATPGNSMLFQNPPDHTRLRGLVNRAFTPRMIEKYRDRVQTITHHLLDDVQADGHMDLIAKFAYLLPVTVIAEMLGVPPADHVLFQQWSKQLVKGLDLADKTAFQEALEAALNAFNTYFSSLIAECRTAPKDDLLSALVAAEEAGDRLTASELYATCRLLLVAGHETTVNLIGNGVLALLRHDDQRQQLQEHPELIASAVEELLRYDGPIQLISRTVLEEMAYQGHTLRQGQVVGFLIGAANRDAAQFKQPNQLDLTRRNNAHLAFGHGIHYCLGAPLARLEGQIAINTLLQRLPTLTLDTEMLTYQDNFVFRGLETFPVSW
jgi:cytochrome P450